MSQGSPVIQVRVPRHILAQVDEVMARVNATRTEEEYTRSSFVLSAIQEKLAKMERGRRKRPKAQPAVVAGVQADQGLDQGLDQVANVQPG